VTVLLSRSLISLSLESPLPNSFKTDRTFGNKRFLGPAIISSGLLPAHRPAVQKH
jgi:hypothetical protein